MNMASRFKRKSVKSIDNCLTFTMSFGVSRICPSTVYWPSSDSCMILDTFEDMFPIRILEFSSQPVVVLLHQTFATFAYNYIETRTLQTKNTTHINTACWSPFGIPQGCVPMVCCLQPLGPYN